MWCWHYVVIVGILWHSNLSACANAQQSTALAKLNSSATYDHCTTQFYQELSHHPVKNDVRQPLLLGMPNSGVVLMREILEQITRKYGGTIGHANGSTNLNYEQLFPQGTTCSGISDYIASENPQLVAMGKTGTIIFTSKALERLCRFSGVYTFRYFIFIARNPFDAIVRGYQMQSASHETNFNDNRWVEFATKSAQMYDTMWSSLLQILSEMGNKQMIVRYEHLMDPKRYHELLLGLMTFKTRAVIFRETALSYFHTLNCIDKFTARRDYDRVDTTRFVGQPYLDIRFVRELTRKLHKYLDYFGYESLPPPYFVEGSDEQPLKEISNKTEFLFGWKTQGCNVSLWAQPDAPVSTAVAKSTANIASTADSSMKSASATDQQGNNNDSGTEVTLSSQQKQQHEYCDKLNTSIGHSKHSSLRSPNPPLLLGLPGSGAVYLRKLIEMVTGLHTGSLGLAETAASFSTSSSSSNSVDRNHKELAGHFAADRHCGSHLAVIFCQHPNFLFRSEVTSSTATKTLSKYRFEMKQAIHRNKCKNLKEKAFSKIIILMRNPFDAIISAYGHNVQDVVSVNENWYRFVKESIALYVELWKLISDIIAKRRTQNEGENIFLVKYEDLVSADDVTRENMMKQIALFIGNLADSHESELIHSLRLKCISMLTSYSDYYHVTDYKFDKIPFLQDQRNILKDYMLYFNYSEPAYTVSATTEPIKVGGSNANNASNSDTNSNRLAVLVPPLELRYSQRLSKYVPSIIVDGSVNKSVAIARCAQHFGVRIFKLEPDPPPLLLSFAGSGNTWVRLLIEFSTGYYSGSTDTSDRVLKDEFIGERFCNRRTSVIKAHPPQLVLNNVTGRATLSNMLQKLKCNYGGMYSFDRFIILVRDPFLAIFAEVNREITLSHVGSPSAEKFLASDWYSLMISEAKDYYNSWHNLIRWLSEVNDSQKVHVSRYEALTDSRLRDAELYQLSLFVAPYDRASLERIQCAFIQSDLSTVHRTKNKDAMTAARLYSNKTLVEEIWAYVGEFSAYAGYTKFQSPLVSN